MDIFFINLASQAARREALQASFAASDTARWRLNRIEAVTAQAALAQGIAGELAPAEKACILSHLQALRASLAIDDHVMIAEDDVQFGQHSASTIEKALRTIPGDAWDIIFTDAIIAQLDTMYQLYLLRQQFDRTGHDGLLDLAGMTFAGSMAYIVNRHSKEKLLEALSLEPFDTPCDLRLRYLVNNRILRAYVIFPFATTQADTGSQSQIQPTAQNHADAVWAAFRQLVWKERDVAQAMRSLAAISVQPDDASLVMAKIFALIVSDCIAGK